MTKHSFFAAALLGLSALAQAGTSVSVAVDEPGFYGRVEIGDQRPKVVYTEPVVVRHTEITEVQRPIYMRVPPGHYKHWARHCEYYRACGQRVYFVDGPAARAFHRWRAENRARWRAANRDYHESARDYHDDRARQYGRGERGRGEDGRRGGERGRHEH
jgi:hypothetical protein